MMGGKLRFVGIMLWCCLGTALPGCIAHRPFLGERGWVADFPRFRTDASATDTAASKDGRSSVAESKPELLPWRNRLRDRLEARFGRGRDAAVDDSAHAIAAKTSSHLRDEANWSGSSLEDGAIQIPEMVASRPERTRPDFVIE
jgi:hypothetical protein